MTVPGEGGGVERRDLDAVERSDGVVRAAAGGHPTPAHRVAPRVPHSSHPQAQSGQFPIPEDLAQGSRIVEPRSPMGPPTGSEPGEETTRPADSPGTRESIRPESRVPLSVRLGRVGTDRDEDDPARFEGRVRAIRVLLTHYRDVLDGIRDSDGRDPCGSGCCLQPKDQHLCDRYGCASAAGVIAAMSAEWNHASYQELERLLAVMSQRLPKARQALRVRFERYVEKRVAYCRVCRGVEPAWMQGKPHRGRVGPSGKLEYCRLAGKTPDLLARVDRVLPSDDEPLVVQEAIEWLGRYWRGDWNLPQSIAQIESTRAFREAA